MEDRFWKSGTVTAKQGGTTVDDLNTVIKKACAYLDGCLYDGAMGFDTFSTSKSPTQPPETALPGDNMGKDDGEDGKGKILD